MENSFFTLPRLTGGRACFYLKSLEKTILQMVSNGVLWCGQSYPLKVAVGGKDVILKSFFYIKRERMANSHVNSTSMSSLHVGVFAQQKLH